MDQPHSQEKPKKVVILGGNGGIGEETAHALARQMQKTGKELEVWVITRPDPETNPKKKGNRGLGVAMELWETEATNTQVDLLRAFDDRHCMEWDGKNQEIAAKIFKDAAVIINTAGAPRKERKDGTAPERSTLIGPNNEYSEDVGTAVAAYAPINAVVANCANPADNIGLIIEKACRKKWKEMGMSSDQLPEFKVLTMGGTLDETRMKVLLAKEINSALAVKNGHENQRVLPSNIDVMIYSQHGPTMVIDRDSTKIRENKDAPWESYKDFMQKPSVRLQDQAEAILTAAEKKTVVQATTLLKNLKRTTQSAPAERLAEMTMAVVGEPYKLTGSVVHSAREGNSRDHVASGVRVIVSPKGIELDKEWLAQVEANADLKQRIIKSDQAIIADQAAYELAEMVRKAGAGISRPSADSHRVEINWNPVSLTELSKLSEGKQPLEKAAELAREAFSLKDEDINRSRTGPSPTLVLNANGALKKLTSLAESVGYIKEGEEIPVTGMSKAG